MNAAPASGLLRDLADTQSGRVSLGAVLKAMGSRSHGLALLLLALPDSLPLPVPSTSIVLGIPMVVIAAHLIVYGEGSRLPRVGERVSVSPALIRGLARYGAPVLQFLERLSRPRWPGFVRSDRVLGVLCLYLSVLLLLPIPFFNAAPAICLVVIALGMIHRDGAMVAAGILGTAVLTMSLVFFADWASSFVGRLLGDRPLHAGRQ